MANLAGIFLALMLLTGCVITGASGTRTEYEDKMKIIEKDLSEHKITRDEYAIQKDRASQEGSASQKNEQVNTLSSEK
ncbi:MAG: hypothetical protein HQL30_09785 [Candidatus Omnitrophica bacterium]|nr:hypothetical protein [Candidatus Omnitrophota bacterium]